MASLYARDEIRQWGIHPDPSDGDSGEDKLRLISESARGEGGRIWVYGDSSKSIMAPDGKTIPCGKTGEPWYFLEEMYPCLWKSCATRHWRSRGLAHLRARPWHRWPSMQVYLDVSHLSAKVQHKIESVLDIYRKFTGDDPHQVPMKIFPAVHYSMGGAWVDWPAADDPDRMQRFRQMTNIPGCFNVGESEFQYHGANRLGANSLLSCIFGGLVAGMEVPRYLETLSASYGNLPSRLFADALTSEETLKQDLMTREGKENVHRLHDELADVMIKNVTVKRNNADLKKTVNLIKEIRERYKQISLDDRGSTVNQTYAFASQFGPMLEIALVITKGALLRDEFRGSHYKPEFSQREDQNWLKTTLATYDPNQDEPVISYLPVDLRYLKPVARDYSKAKKVVPHFENVPANIKLPI